MADHEYPQLVSWDDLDDLPDIDYNIINDLKRGILGYGFETPSPIQKKTLFPILSGRDVIAQAQSGTGKTGAFVIGMLARLDWKQATTQALIISPTHELATQTTQVVKELSKYLYPTQSDNKYSDTKNHIHTLVGGTNISEDLRILKTLPKVVVGCTGKILHMIQKNALILDNLKILVLDEADELLSKCFQDPIIQILNKIPEKTQLLLVSATLPPTIQPTVQQIMRNPITLSVKSEQLTLEGIENYYIALDRDSDKLETLKDLYSSISMSQCIIFCNSVLRVEDVYRKLIAENFPVCCIHSEMNKQDREEYFQEFKQGKYRVLLSTNLTSRGIDIQQVSVVINYDLPKDISTYLHRIGRSGRWGRKGTGINFITKSDVPILKEIERFYACQIKELPASFVQK
jgi:translation initiation factor 4A